MRKWTVEVNFDGGLLYRKITFVVEAASSKRALAYVCDDLFMLQIPDSSYQAHIV